MKVTTSSKRPWSFTLRPNARPADDPALAANAANDPEVVAAAAAAGIDALDAEALEEAEDVDGVLELIGMQGPWMNMIQNVIFCEFLITLTLAASVWLPYIWGKITLLILANPIATLFWMPLQGISWTADLVVDTLLFAFSVTMLVLHFVFSIPTTLLSWALVWRPFFLDSSIVKTKSLVLARGSGSRLESSIQNTLQVFRPDLSTFSVVSHNALKMFEYRIAGFVSGVSSWLIRLGSIIHGQERQYRA